MGWKAVKEHYGIVHIVQVTDAGICIGSPYIHDIVVVGQDGTILKGDRNTVNGDLARYQAEMAADPARLRELIAAPDSFSASIPVFTYDGARIIEKQCEELGWPNVTHDGQMMYENTFSPDREQAVEWAKRNCLAGIEWTREAVANRRADLEEAEARLAQRLGDAAILGIEVPEEPLPARSPGRI